MTGKEFDEVCAGRARKARQEMRSPALRDAGAARDIDEQLRRAAARTDEL